MVDKIGLDELDRFNELGIQVNSNFVNLFSLNDILNSEFDYVYGYYLDSKLVGFIHLNKMYENIDIVNIVVDPLHRNLGIAISLIESIEKNYPDCEHLFLEVREDNIPAINLYKKMSFLEINRRKNYYDNADALVMERNIKK